MVQIDPDIFNSQRSTENIKSTTLMKELIVVNKYSNEYYSVSEEATMFALDDYGDPYYYEESMLEREAEEIYGEGDANDADDDDYDGEGEDNEEKYTEGEVEEEYTEGQDKEEISLGVVIINHRRRRGQNNVNSSAEFYCPMRTNGPVEDTSDVDEDVTGILSPVPDRYRASLNTLMRKTDEYYEIDSEENEEERTKLIGLVDFLSESDNEP